MNHIYTTESAASYLGVSQSRVRKLIKEGRLPAEKQGRDHIIQKNDLIEYARHGRKNVGRPADKSNYREIVREDVATYKSKSINGAKIGNGEIILGDALRELPRLNRQQFQLIIADPPYYQVLLDEQWDNIWKSEDEYLDWTIKWVRECKRVLRPDGLLYVFGQLGKREHVWLHACSLLAKEMQFHDMIIWDRAVGYNERSDSFTPQYEMILALRQFEGAKPYFDKDAVRLQYDESTIQTYMKDNRYKDKEAREQHLRKGKYATNLIRIPSLKGASKEKIGHPSQKPIALINQLVASSSRKGDTVLDPFLGSGTTAAAAETLGRKWVGIESNPEYCEIARKRIANHLVEPEFIFG